MSPVSLTVTVITLNEEKNLPRCLHSVRGLADEILVIDSESKDRTQEVAKGLGARVLVNPWPGHKEQKQFAVDHASHDWILSLDADEWITPKLEAEILAILGNSPEPDSYAINRFTKFLGRFMRHSWQPDWNVRLFHRKVAYWGGVNPHDHIFRFDEGASQRLEQPFFHDSYQSIFQYLDRLNSYTSIAADAPEAKRFRPEKLVFSPLVTFLKMFLLRGGFRDGLHGLILSAYGGVYAFSKYAKLWEKQLGPGEPDPGGPFPDLDEVLEAPTS
jgi:glycosyltransferase involved in cell wall biosynthesis